MERNQITKELEAVDKTIKAGIRELMRHQVWLTREQWLKEAERCEGEGRPRTCEAIVKATAAMEVAYVLKVFPDKKRTAELEKAHGTRWAF